MPAQLRHIPDDGPKSGKGRPRRQPLVPGDQRLQVAVSDEQWRTLIALLCTGVSPAQAVQTVQSQPGAIEAILRTDRERLEEYNGARVAAMRRNWSIEDFQGICDALALGQSLQKACNDRGKDHGNFIKLTLRDPVLKEMYEDARKVRAELYADEVADLADDDGNDMDLTGKGNMASVGRSNLQVMTRLRLMEQFNVRRYGKQPAQTEVNVQVNVNHAERLEAARSRARNGVTLEPVKDAEFTETAQVEDMSFLE